MQTNEGQVNKKTKETKKIGTLDGVVCSNPGSHVAPVYKRVYNKELDKVTIEKVDEFNIYEFIQASKSQTDLAILEKRYIELGEIPNVDPNLGSNDMTLFPSNIHEVYAMVNDVAGNFNKLPKSVQEVFGSKEDYLKALLDGTYNSKLLNAFNKTKEEPAPAPAPKEGDK